MPTLKDVARDAGVSAATVSRYLNGTARLSPETRAAVERAVHGLGYRPNRVAQRLRVAPGSSRLVGLVVPDLQNPFFADVTRGVERAAYAAGCAVLLGHSDEQPDRETFYLDLLRAESVDGIVLPSVRDGAAVRQTLEHLGLPVVCIDREPADVDVDCVSSNNEEGGRVATAHLLALGHRRIGFVGGLPHVSTSIQRRAGYRAALAAAGVPEEPALVSMGDARQASGRERTGALLDGPDPPTALLVGNNLMTLGALEAIRARGLRLPDDVALVGYDDIPWAAAFNPPLTCVRQPGVEMGERATELLLRRIAALDAPTRRLVLTPTLVVRGSCGATAPAAARAGT